MSDESPAASSSTLRPEATRRRLLAWMGAGGAAALATLFSRNEAHAGHDGTNVLHLGEGNSVPPGSKTGVASNVNAFSFDVDNFHTGATAGGLHGRSLGNLPGIQGVGHEPSFAGVFGVSSNASGDIGTGSRTGVMGMTGSGSGVHGRSQSGTGVHGESLTGTAGLFMSPSGRALEAQGPSVMSANVAEGPTLALFNGNGTGQALRAETFGGEFGVRGIATTADGSGFGAGPGTGVQGSSGTGIGVLGNTAGTGIGVEARSDSLAGKALQVRGRAVFSTAGAAVIPAGADSAFVPNPAVTEESHISVTLVSDPGSRQAMWVERDPGSGFTVHTSSQTKKAPETALTYLVVEPYE